MINRKSTVRLRRYVRFHAVFFGAIVWFFCQLSQATTHNDLTTTDNPIDETQAENRPKTHSTPILVWFVQQQKGQQRFIQRTDTAIYQPLQTAAEQQGLLLLFPLFDSQDLRALSPIQLAANNLKNIRHASQRYPTEWILTLYFYPDETGWQSRWHLYRDQQHEHWQDAGQTIETPLQQGIVHASQYLQQPPTHAPPVSVANVAMAIQPALEPPIEPTEQIKPVLPADNTTTRAVHSMEVWIENLSQAEDFSLIKNYFSQFKEIYQVDVVRVENQRALFILTTAYDEAQLRQYLTVGQRLQTQQNQHWPWVFYWK